MKYVFIIMVLISFASYAEESTKSCMATAKTQTDINICAGSNSNQADVELNAVYKEILKKYSGQPEFLKKLKASQMAWLKFRDAELEALFPVSEPGYYGSGKSMCLNDWLTIITQQRVKELRRWLDPVKDDMCNGSIGVM